MANSSPKSARQKAAEARAAAEAAEKRRRLLINVAIGAVLAVVVAGIIAGALISRGGSSNGGDGPVADAVQPTGAFPVDSPYKGGIPAADEPISGKPVVEIWEDFQCPACKTFELAFGPMLNQMADKGEAEIIWRSTSFLDQGIPGQNSQRAAAAWGCAIDAGRKTEYHDLVYANQPPEGEGYSDQQLLAFAEQAGITGQAKTEFEQCFAEKKYMPWAANGTAWMRDAGIPGTPGVYVNGNELPDTALQSPETLRQAIIDAGPAPSPSS